MIFLNLFSISDSEWLRLICVNKSNIWDWFFPWFFVYQKHISNLRQFATSWDSLRQLNLFIVFHCISEHRIFWDNLRQRSRRRRRHACMVLRQFEIFNQTIGFCCVFARSHFWDNLRFPQFSNFYRTFLFPQNSIFHRFSGRAGASEIS